MRPPARGVPFLVVIALASLVLPTVQSAEPGEVLWTEALAGPVWSPLTLHDGTLYVGSDDGSVTAYDPQARQVLWKVETDGCVRSSVLVQGEMAVFSSDDGNVYAVHAQTGEARWHSRVAPADFKRTLPSPMPPYSYDSMQSSPVSDGHAVFVGGADGNFRALRLRDGKLLWSFSTEERIRATAAVDAGTVYFGSWDGNLYAVDAETGKLRWQHATGGIVQGAVAVGDGRVIVGSRSARLQAVDAKSGELVWEFADPNGSWIESSPVILDGVVYVGSSDARQMFALSLDTGEQRWVAPTHGWSWGTPLVVDDVVYIGAVGAFPYGQKLEGGFFAFDRNSGELQWEMETAVVNGFINGGVFAMPVVLGDVLYVAAVDGSLTALRR